MMKRKAGKAKPPKKRTRWSVGLCHELGHLINNEVKRRADHGLPHANFNAVLTELALDHATKCLGWKLPTHDHFDIDFLAGHTIVEAKSSGAKLEKKLVDSLKRNLKKPKR